MPPMVYSDPLPLRTARRQIEARHQARQGQARFRRDPQTYLATLEQVLLKPALPS
jgi:hypothetical protein